MKEMMTRRSGSSRLCLLMSMVFRILLLLLLPGFRYQSTLSMTMSDAGIWGLVMADLSGKSILQF